MKSDDSKNKPWLKSDGQTMSDLELKQVCAHWSPQQWEDYLSTLDGKQMELLLDDPTAIENVSQEDHDKALLAISDEIDGSSHPSLQEVITKILKRIPKNQRQVLNYIFWEDLSLSEAARRLGVTRSAVQHTRDRALKRVHKMLLQVTSRECSVNQVKNSLKPAMRESSF